MSPSVSAVASAERIAEAKQFDDTTLGIKRSHGGRIKTRLANKSNTVLWITLGILAAVTVFTFIIMDYGKSRWYKQFQLHWKTLPPCSLSPGWRTTLRWKMSLLVRSSHLHWQL